MPTLPAPAIGLANNGPVKVSYNDVFMIQQIALS